MLQYVISLLAKTHLNRQKQFIKTTAVISLAITKLEEKIKDKVVIGISSQFLVKYIGVGERIDDLQVFIQYEFIDSYFK